MKRQRNRNKNKRLNFKSKLMNLKMGITNMYNQLRTFIQRNLKNFNQGKHFKEVL